MLRENNWTPWAVAYMNPPDEHANAVIVAARTTRARISTVVEDDNMFHREYMRNGETHLSYSRLVVGQVAWHKPMHGREATQFACVHFHHSVANKGPSLVVLFRCEVYILIIAPAMAGLLWIHYDAPC